MNELANLQHGIQTMTFLLQLRCFSLCNSELLAVDCGEYFRKNRLRALIAALFSLN